MAKHNNRRVKRSLTPPVERALVDVASKQPRFQPSNNRQLVFNSIYHWYKNELQQEPAYMVDNRARDTWLDKIWRKEPHIAGVISSAVSIDTNRGLVDRRGPQSSQSV